MATAMSTRPSTWLRLLLSVSTLVTMMLLVASFQQPWWYFGLELNAPYVEHDGALNRAFGGPSLLWRRDCVGYGNTTFDDGTPMVAQFLCIYEEIDLANPLPYDVAARNKAIVAAVVLAIFACGFTLCLLGFAPEARPVWEQRYKRALEDAHVPLAATSGSSSGTSSSGSGGSAGEPLVAGGMRGLSCLQSMHLRVTYAADWLLTLMPLRWYVCTVLVGPAVFLGTGVALYSNDADGVDDISFIAANARGVDCTTECASYNVNIGWGLLCAAGAGGLMFLQVAGGVLTYLVPRCCPVLLAIDASTGVAAGGAVVGADDDDDDDEEGGGQHHPAWDQAALVGGASSGGGVVGADQAAAGAASTGAVPLELSLPEMQRLRYATGSGTGSGMLLVPASPVLAGGPGGRGGGVVVDDDEDDLVQLPALGNPLASISKLLKRSSSGNRADVAAAVASTAGASEGAATDGVVVLAGYDDGAAHGDGTPAPAAATDSGGASASSAGRSAATASAGGGAGLHVDAPPAAVEASSSRPLDASTVSTATGGAAADPPRHVSASAARAVPLPEHPILHVSQPVFLAFRLVSIVALACSFACFGSPWWRYSFGQEVSSTGEPLWTGGVNVNEIRMHSKVGTPFWVVAQLSDCAALGSSPSSFFAPMIAAGIFVALGVLGSALLFAVAMPHDNAVIDALTVDFLRCCRNRPVHGLVGTAQLRQHRAALLQQAQAGSESLLGQHRQAAALELYERWSARPTPTLRRLAAVARYGHLSALAIAIAGVTATVAALTFDWSTFLWVYVDVLHLPGLPFHDSLGDGVIYSLVSAVLLLGVGWTATRMLATRQQRYKRIVEDAIAEEVDQLAAVASGSSTAASGGESGGLPQREGDNATGGDAADAAPAALP